MGAYRTRFTPAEREAFTLGAEVEWLDATRWKPGRVAGEISVDAHDLSGRQQELPVENRAVTGFTRAGEVVRVLPKHVRVKP